MRKMRRWRSTRKPARATCAASRLGVVHQSGWPTRRMPSLDSVGDDLEGRAHEREEQTAAGTGARGGARGAPRPDRGTNETPRSRRRRRTPRRRTAAAWRRRGRARPRRRASATRTRDARRRAPTCRPRSRSRRPIAATAPGRRHEPLGEPSRAAADVEHPAHGSDASDAEHRIVHGPVGRELHEREVVDPRPGVEEPRASDPSATRVDIGEASLDRNGQSCARRRPVT